MEKIINLAHGKSPFLFAGSRVFERVSYYGTRSLIVLYMVSGTINLSRTESLKIYSLFFGSALVAKIVGALFGDLLIGNKKAIIIGGLLQMIGTLVFCIPSITALYVGLTMMVLAEGLYTPNLMAQFGKLYLDKTKLLDSAFALIYLSALLGALFGPFVASIIDKSNFIAGFVTASICPFISLALFLVPKEGNAPSPNPKGTTLGNKFGSPVHIIACFIIMAVFWGGYEISFPWVQTLANNIRASFDNHFVGLSITSFDSFFELFTCIAIAILWSYWYSGRVFKISIGLLVMGGSLLVLLPIQYIPMGQIGLFILHGALFSISEAMVSPVLFSVLAKNTNPKYLATSIALLFVPQKIVLFVYGIVKPLLEFGLYTSVLLSIVCAFLAGAILLAFKDKAIREYLK